MPNRPPTTITIAPRVVVCLISFAWFLGPPGGRMGDLLGGGHNAQAQGPTQAPPTQSPTEREPIAVGSKKFTESVILAEILAQWIQTVGRINTTHRAELGGSRIVFHALLRGDLDAYPEYTGTLRGELFANELITKDADLERALAQRGLRMTGPLGFNNTYALGVTRATATRHQLRRISDLARHPDLQCGVTEEFLARGDGWPGLKATYRLNNTVRGLDHDLAYRALIHGDIDVMDLYTTDAEIAEHDLVVLEDDRGYFPRYDAVVVYREDLLERHPNLGPILQRLEGSISGPSMARMNQLGKIGRSVSDGAQPTQVPAAQIAQEFLREQFGVATEAVVKTRYEQFWETTRQHLTLVGLSMALTIGIGIPLGIFAAKVAKLGAMILLGVGALQTLPALALLVFLIPLFGLSATTAILALFLYSLLPIVRNTHTGLQSIPSDLRESALAIGLTPWQRLWDVELPLATPIILAGIKTSVVMNIGTATLAALIGAGGYGQPILTGIRLDDYTLILWGAGPAAGLALAAQGGFDLLEAMVVPRGLKSHFHSHSQTQTQTEAQSNFPL